ncbi:hypothetical protein M422DRAFT_226547 [Sphaerobolus stellatus SS14]|uniref:Peroxidase n=1 Tax=Sphaerobolus stellatus (strain SS14) TaxID=990650 RepID=A0A0C9VUZ4_SPHS4|nr:hypothetical protein M422DRAFT_226547 [Sphaerobolus stellatus SS14]
MATPAPAPTPALNLDNIQGDVLEGFPKRFESFLFFQITNATLFRQKLKAVIPFITNTTKVLADTKAINEHKNNGGKGLLKLSHANIAFSAKGLKALGIADQLGDSFFTNGQLADASATFANGGIEDPGKVTGTTIDPAWDPLFKQEIHAVFIVAGESQLTINAELVTLTTLLLGSIKVLGTETGNVRPGNEAGHEPFGFNDGLSNPPVIGFRAPNTGEIPTKPGVILLGEDGDSVTRQAPWAKDSSFFVFRKLEQRVPEFNLFLKQNALKGPGLTADQGSELLGARLVGRWKSGAPIDRDPLADNPADAADPNKVNDFDYSDDPTEIRCPFAAHLRKMNPRNGAIPGLAGVQVRRIIRQGIPYGPEVTFDEASSGVTKHSRGLLFVCYQSNLSLGFHFLQRTWANNPNFPNATNGFDPIIGQAGNNPRTTSGTDPNNLTGQLNLPQLFVVPKGGEYFVSPSISALKTTFAA